MSELERMAIAKAREAVYLDKIGSRPEAASRYREAIQMLWRLYSLTDSPVLREVYREKIQQYNCRLAELGEGKQPLRFKQQREEKPIVVVERPGITWDDVIGLEDAKQALKECIIYPYLRPDLFPLGWPTGILLYGPPGCGKTLIIAAASNEIDATLYSVSASQIMSKWLGESERNVAELFEVARREASSGRPVIIFIDEVDSLAASRYLEVGGEVRVRNQLLNEMDGLTSKGRREYVYVIGATNKPWVLDEPFIRRFQRRIYIKHPDRDCRTRLFRHYTRRLKLDQSVELDKLSDMTEGYSAADIYSICLDAHMMTIREVFENGLEEPRAITMQDFELAIAKRKPSLVREHIARFEEWCARYGTM